MTFWLASSSWFRKLSITVIVVAIFVVIVIVVVVVVLPRLVVFFHMQDSSKTIRAKSGPKSVAYFL